MNLVKAYSTISSPLSQLKQSQIHKSKSKFTRTQEAQKVDKKKAEIKLKEEERICFISPNKLRVTPLSTNKMLSPSSHQHSSKPQFSQQESIIQTNRCNVDEMSKMNDSLLSIYDQLNSQNQRKRDTDIFLLRKQLQNMKAIVQEQRIQKGQALERLKDIQYLQNFLMERETYICNITEKNIVLNEKLLKAQQQKQALQKELVYLRNSYELSLKKYQQQMIQMKNKNHVLSQQNKALKQSNKQLKLHIEDYFIQHNQSTTVIESFITEKQEKKEQKFKEAMKGTNQKSVAQKLNQNVINLVLHKSDQFIEENQLTYRALYSSRSNRLQMQRSFEYDNNQDMNFATCKRSCSCSKLISKLNQKIRYNQIQIDILKRMKGRGEFVESDNQKLKRQIKSLTQRIEYLSENKKQKKKRSSESPLELSLSPKKQKKHTK